MAAVEPMDELKECLRASVEMLLDKLNDRLHEDMDGVDYLCIQLDRIHLTSYFFFFFFFFYIINSLLKQIDINTAN